MSRPEYYDGIDSYLYSLVHHTTNTGNLNPTRNEQQLPISEPYSQVPNPWTGDTGRYYDNGPISNVNYNSNYNSNYWNWQYYNYGNSYNSNYYKCKFRNDPVLGRGAQCAPFRSYSNNAYTNNTHWKSNQQFNNYYKPNNEPNRKYQAPNNTPVRKVTQNGKDKNLFSKNSKKRTNRTTKKNKKFNQTRKKNSLVSKPSSMLQNNSVPNEKIASTTNNQNDPIPVTNSICVEQTNSLKSVENNTKSNNQKTKPTDEIVTNDTPSSNIENKTSHIDEKSSENCNNEISNNTDETNSAKNLETESEKPLEKIDSNLEETQHVLQTENVAIFNEDNKENLDVDPLFIIDTEADYTNLEKTELFSFKETATQIDSQNKTVELSETSNQTQIENDSVIKYNKKTPKKKPYNWQGRVRTRKFLSRTAKTSAEQSTENSQIIIIEDSDSDMTDSVIEIPKPPVPVVVIDDSDDAENLSSDEQQKEEKSKNENVPILQTPEKSGQHDGSDTLIILNETDEIFVTPESMKNSKEQKKNSKQLKRKLDREYPSRMSTPDSKCSYDDFMQNDFICLQNNKNNELRFGALNSQSLEDVTNVFDKTVQNTMLNEIVDETESSCCSDWVDKTGGISTHLSFENTVNKSNNEKRTYEELDLNHFASMITPNRSSVSTIQNTLIESTKRSNENTTAVSFGADDLCKVIKTKKRNYIHTDSSSDESEINNSKYSRRQRKNSKDKEKKQKKDDTNKEQDSDVSAVIFPSNTTNLLTNSKLVGIDYDEFSQQLGSTDTATTINLEEKSLNKNASVICVSDESNSENDSIICSSTTSENSTIILNVNRNNQPKSFEEDCLKNVNVSPSKKNIQPNKNITSKDIQKRATDLKMRFNAYWTPDRNEFYNKSWGGENYDHDVERTLMPRSLKDWMIPYDYNNFTINCEQSKLKRCHNCRQRGHEKRNCPVPSKACRMCGSRRHCAFKCTELRCLTCFSEQRRSFVNNCEKCKRWVHHRCRVCNSLGHMGKVCPDLWRRYHLTTRKGGIVQPHKDSKSNNPSVLWCSVCARPGHLGENCKFYFSISRCRPNPMTIQDYSDVYSDDDDITTEASSSKKKKFENSNCENLWDIHKITYDQAHLNGQRTEICKNIGTEISKIPLQGTSTDVVNKDKNDNNCVPYKEFEVVITAVDAKDFKSNLGRKFVAEIKEKYSAEIKIELKCDTYHVLKVKCPEEHCKTIDDCIKNFMINKDKDSKEVKKIKNDCVLLPRIFKLKTPYTLTKKLRNLKQKDQLAPRERRRLVAIEKKLSAFLIGKEKLANSKMAVHCLRVLDQFCKRTDNRQINNEVMKAHQFIFLHGSLKKYIMKYKLKSKSQTVDVPTEIELKEENSNIKNYIDKLLGVCKRRNLRRKLIILKKQMRANEFKSKQKRRLLHFGKLLNVPYECEQKK